MCLPESIVPTETPPTMFHTMQMLWSIMNASLVICLACFPRSAHVSKMCSPRPALGIYSIILFYLRHKRAGNSHLAKAQRSSPLSFLEQFQHQALVPNICFIQLHYKAPTWTLSNIAHTPFFCTPSHLPAALSVTLYKRIRVACILSNPPTRLRGHTETTGFAFACICVGVHLRVLAAAEVLFIMYTLRACARHDSGRSCCCCCWCCLVSLLLAAPLPGWILCATARRGYNAQQSLNITLRRVAPVVTAVVPCFVLAHAQRIIRVYACNTWQCKILQMFTILRQNSWRARYTGNQLFAICILVSACAMYTVPECTVVHNWLLQ